MNEKEILRFNQTRRDKIKKAERPYTTDEGIDEILREDETEKPEKEKKRSLFELMKKWNNTISAVVLALALEIGFLGAHSGMKIKEYLDIKTKQEQIDKKLTEAEKSERVLRKKMKEIKELFNGYVEFTAKFKRELEKLRETNEEAEEEAETFTFFEGARDIRKPEEAKENAKNETEDKQDQVQISDFYVFNKIKIDKTSVKKMVKETFPDSWIRGEVGEIVQLNREKKLPQKYGDIKGRIVADCDTGAGYKNRAKITFYAPSRERGFTDVSEVLSHELAHANDWERDNEMSKEERADLLLSIAKRVKAEDRFMSSYVESIENKDKKMEFYLKTTEYFAEICEIYFSHPEDLHFKDFKIADDYIRKTDPDFNVKKFAAKRQKIIDIAMSRAAQLPQ